MVVRKKRVKRTVVIKRRRTRDTELPPVRRKKRVTKGVGTAKKRIVSDINPIDVGERGPTGPASM